MARITMTQTFDISAAIAKGILAAAKQGKPSTLTFTFTPTLQQVAQVSGAGTTAQISAALGPIQVAIVAEHG